MTDITDTRSALDHAVPEWVAHTSYARAARADAHAWTRPDGTRPDTDQVLGSLQAAARPIYGARLYRGLRITDGAADEYAEDVSDLGYLQTELGSWSYSREVALGFMGDDGGVLLVMDGDVMGLDLETTDAYAGTGMSHEREVILHDIDATAGLVREMAPEVWEICLEAGPIRDA